jgi:inorganic pyrophosphatase
MENEAADMTGGARKDGASVATWRKDGTLHVLVDTPRGSAVKFKLDPESGVYTVSHILTPGAVFPFDFGSIPRTSAEDGDPLDLLVLAEAPTFPGCLVSVRLVGALEARQTQEGKTMRNDRLLGVAAESRAYARIRNLREIPAHLLHEIEHFFVSYNEARGRRFRVVRRVGPQAAKRLVRAAERRFESGTSRPDAIS